MASHDSLQLDEHLARLLAAYDQDIGGGDGRAPTVNVRDLPPEVRHFLDQNTELAERPVESLGADPNVGSLSELAPGRTPPPPPPALPGGPHRVGRFELRRQLGKGGCGIVFLAYDPTLRRDVALKIPRPEMLLSPDARKRLLREAQAAAEFDHPNLVPVYETGEIGPVCFIATAYCPGITLAEWIDRQLFPVPVRQAARLVAVLAEAVQHAHDRGILHRDLKPNNVLLQDVPPAPPDAEPVPGSCNLRGEQFVPRVLDFGLAKVADRGPSETGSRQILGTPKYMAPEQAQGRKDEIGPTADVYAIGVILYELLAGRAPYDGSTDVDVLRQAIAGQYDHPRHVRGEIPRDLEAICLKAMAKSPAKRYRSAIDLADDLRRFLAGLPTIARPLAWTGRATRWLRRNDQMVALTAVTSLALFFLLVGGYSTYLNRGLKQSQQRLDEQKKDAERRERQRVYSKYVRDAFLYWRAGEIRQMDQALAAARAQSVNTAFPEPPCFAWGYLAQVGRVELRSVHCPAGPVRAVAVSPDGDRVVTGHEDGTVAVWPRTTDKPLAAARAGDKLTHLLFTRGGRGLATAGAGGVRLWDFHPGAAPTPGKFLAGADGAVTALATDPEGAKVYAGLETGRVVVWNVAQPARPLRAWAAADDEPAVAVAVSPDGKAVATTGRAGAVRLWDASGQPLRDANQRPLPELRGTAGAATLAFVPVEGGWLLAAAGTPDGAVRLYSRDGREARPSPLIGGHSDAVLAVVASPNGAVLASAGSDDSVCLWDTTTGAMRTLLRSHTDVVRGVQFTPDGKALVTAAADGLLKTWDLAADPEGRSVRGLTSGVAAVAVRPDGGRYAAAFTDGAVEVYSRSGGDAVRHEPGGRGPLTVLRFPAEGPPVGVELAGRAAVCWEFGPTGQAKELLRVELPDGAVATTADLSTESGMVAIGDDRGQVSVWAVKERAPAIVFDTRSGNRVGPLTLSPSGFALATPTQGQLLGIWTVPTSDPWAVVRGHNEGLWAVRFLRDGRRVVTAGRGTAIRVWNVATKEKELELLGHIGKVTALVVSPDDRTLVSGSPSGDVRFWDLKTGQELFTLQRHPGMAVMAADFSADGRLLVTGGQSQDQKKGDIVLWEAAKE